MLEQLSHSRVGAGFPSCLGSLALDMFAIVQHWEPPDVPAAERGRLFEQVLYRYCAAKNLNLTERAGSRTLLHRASASGFSHESDAVISFAELSLHLELKYLSTELQKNDLLIFNQKGLDFIFAAHSEVRKKPLYRVLLSAGLLSPAARKFALQWGIIVVEPDRLPLVLVHALTERHISTSPEIGIGTKEQISTEVPRIIVPLQDRIRQLARCLAGSEEILSELRVDRALGYFQRECGDRYWGALDCIDASWLESHYEQLHALLKLEQLNYCRM